MVFGRFSSHVTSGWMDDMEAAEKWLTLVSADPLAVSDPLTVEIVGGTLARIQVGWTRTSASLLTINEAAVFRGIPPGAHVAGVAGFDVAFNGNLLFSDLLDVAVDYPSGGTYVLPVSEYVIGIDVPGA